MDSAQLPGAAGASNARPPTAAGPIPMPASSTDSSALSQRVQQLESQLTALTGAWDRLEGQKAKEEFAKQLMAVKGDGLLTPGGGGSGSGHHQHHHHHSNSNGAAAAAPSSAAAQPAVRRSSNNGMGTSGAAAPPGEAIDGSGLLPANNNFPSRFGGGAAGLRAARDRTPGGRGGPAGDSGDYSGPGGSGGFGGGGGGAGLGLPGHAVSAGGAGGGGAGGPPGGDLMSTHRYGTVMPSDFKLAEQRKAGPRQGFM